MLDSLALLVNASPPPKALVSESEKSVLKKLPRYLDTCKELQEEEQQLQPFMPDTWKKFQKEHTTVEDY